MPNVYTPRMLAEEWSCSERHVRNLISRGELRAFRLGAKLLRISSDAVEDYLCRTTDSSSSEGDGTSPSPKTDAAPATLLAFQARQRSSRTQSEKRDGSGSSAIKARR